MRKILLLGTMLGVAGTALAFGGMFGGGHGGKSTTYKGGVDAIGVHYNGEKKEADSQEEIDCPEYSTFDKSCNECKCDEGYEKNEAGDCVEKCPEGLSRSTRDGTCSICANGNVYLSYMDEPCQYSVSGCASNDDCGEDEYCNLHREDDGSCDSPEEGTCEEIDTVDPVVIAGLGTVVMTSESLQWWAAQNWCKAQGYRMPSADELCQTHITLEWEGDSDGTYVCKNCCTPMEGSSGRDLWVTTHWDDCNPYHVYTGDGGSVWMNTPHTGSAYVICLE